jgi:hypothetical protein
MSDGQVNEGTKASRELVAKGREKKDGTQFHSEPLPFNVRSIDVYFTEAETKFHSLLLHGETSLYIGPHAEVKMKEGYQQGRKETFKVPDG